MISKKIDGYIESTIEKLTIVIKIIEKYMLFQYPYDIVGLTDEVGAMLADRKVAMSANSQIQLVEEDSNFFGLLESIDSKMVDLNRFTKLRHKSK